MRTGLYDGFDGVFPWKITYIFQFIGLVLTI